MSRYARILDGVAVDVCADPAAQFHPQLAAQFEAVPDDVVSGARLVDGDWQALLFVPDSVGAGDEP